MIGSIWIIGAVTTAAMYRWLMDDAFEFGDTPTVYVIAMLLVWPLILTFIVAMGLAVLFDRISSKGEE